METVSTIVCPNCGANTRNFQNCEYCGSLLVRFIDKNIPLAEEKYGKKAQGLQALIDSLTWNLAEQARTSGNNHVHTLIKYNKSSFPIEIDVTNPNSINNVAEYDLATGCSWARISPINIPDTDAQSLVVCLRFFKLDKQWRGSSDVDVRVRGKDKWQIEAHKRFKESEIYPLFSLQTNTFARKIDGEKLGTVYQYYIDFGRDVEGAAAIIKQYLIQVFSVPENDILNLEYDHLSQTDEEYVQVVKTFKKEATRFNAINMGIGILCIVVGAFPLWFIGVVIFDEPEPEFLLAFLICIGVVILGVYFVRRAIKNKF